MTIETESNAKQFRSYPSIVGGALLLAITSLLGIAGQACGGSFQPDGALSLVPDDASLVVVWDVQNLLGEAPDEYADLVENRWRNYFHDQNVGVSLEGLTTRVYAEVVGGWMDVLEGGLDFEQLRARPAGLFAGYPVTVIEERGQAVIGTVFALRNVSDVFYGDSDSLLDDADNEVARVLKKAGHGWVAHARKGCRISGLRGCQALGVAMTRGTSSNRVDAVLAFLFVNNLVADSQVDNLEDFLEDDLPQEMDIDVRVDGEFVVAVVTFKDDDYGVYEEWSEWME